MLQGSINEEAVAEMKPGCLDLSEGENTKKDIKSTLAKSGEGASDRGVRRVKQGNRKKQKAQKLQDQEEEERQTMVEKGLFLCTARCPVTNRYCKSIPFMHQSGLGNHEEKGTHDFPTGIDATSWVRLEASKPGGVVAKGSRPDRQSSTLFEKIIPAPAGSCGEASARCKGRYHRKEGTQAYRKPPLLTDTLQELYALEPKLRALEMRELMKAMRDPADGGLLFCFAKARTNGQLLTEDTIQQWITSRTQNEKKKRNGKSEKDVEQEKQIEQLEKEGSSAGIN
jgi:hypothetical protein